ncbi:uncharacterized protein LOC135220746 [Macrobrachium nipponense]|uniref:uncharacterized protein LOC135220746 n=1 Tax=Macrobrachium nipponense TaxID=159736 RepID=UPI0030C7BBAE
MPHSDVRIQPCKRLDSLSLLALEKFLLRGFFRLGKKDQSFDTAIIGAQSRQDVVSFLCERSRAGPFEELECYLIQKIPVSQRQGLVEDMINLMAEPVFDTEKIEACGSDEFYQLYSESELKFKALDVTAESQEMSEIIYYSLKYLLLDYVTKLDCTGFYTFTSNWVARNRRMFLRWQEMKTGKENITFLSDTNFSFARTHWDALQFNHLSSVGSGVLKASPYFRRLVKINVDHVATGELLWAIGCNCPNLEEISLFLQAFDRNKYTPLFEATLISGMHSFYAHEVLTKTSFRGRPVGCPKLRVIGMPQVDDIDSLIKLSAKLLRYLLCLERLIGVCIPGVIMTLLHEEHHRPESLALKSIEEYPFRERLESVCEYFRLDMKLLLPNVIDVRMVYSKHEGSLNVLSNFPKLEYLQVSSEECRELEFGPNFAHLKELKSNCLWDEKRLVGFSQRASSLELFHLIEGSLLKRKKTKDTISFPKMKEVKVSRLQQCDSDVFVSLMKSCKNLTHVTIEAFAKEMHMLKMLNDQVVSAIVPSLKKLRVFDAKILFTTELDPLHDIDIIGARYYMTEKSVTCLARGCPNLTSVGNVFHWKIPYKKVMELKAEAKKGNWDVNIYPLDDS